MLKCTEEFLFYAKEQGIEEIISRDIPNCVNVMEPTLLEYVPGERLKIKFPVLDTYLNPFNGMQGGFISAAFDNAFGLLCDMVTMKKAASLDLNTNYHRPIYKDDELIIKVYLKYKGNTIVNMYAEAFNTIDELIATADSKMMIIKEKEANLK